MTGDELIPVYSVNDPLQAEVIKNALESAGIPCSIEGEGQAGFTGTFEIRLFVSKADEKQATALIHDHLDKNA